MKKRIVIAILCAAISAGTVGCGKDTALTGTTQTEETKKTARKIKRQKDAVR